MLVVVATSTLKPGKKEAFIKLAGQLAQKTRQEKGCIFYELYEDSKHPNQLSFIEGWASSAALARHGKTEHYMEIVPQLGELREGPAQINIYKKLL